MALAIPERLPLDVCTVQASLPDSTPTLSVVILTLNEEHNIADCIASVQRANEVIVVDSGSSDRTAQLATAAGARVTVHPMRNFADQHNFANAQARSDWILSIDADERVTEALMDEVLSVISDTTHDAFWVPTLNIMLGAEILHGGWYPQPHIRLLRRGHGNWGRQVHERIAVSGTIGTLKNPIVHHSHPDISAFLQKLDRYTDLEVHVNAGSSAWLGIKTVVEPAPYFIYKYVIQQGFRDGWRGLVMALLLTFYRCVGYLKTIESRHRGEDAAIG